MALPIEQQGLYQDGNSIFENVHILGTLNVTGEMEILSSGSEKIRIDSTGVVRIANTNFAASTNADELVIGNTNGNRGITIVSGNTSNGSLFFADDSVNNNGSIVYEHNLNDMRFNTNAIERLRIASNGHVGINSTSPAATLDIRDVGSTGPGILISGCNSTEGDLTVQEGEILHVGHFNSDTNTYTDRFRIESTGVKEIRNGNLELNSTYIDFVGNYNSGLLGQTAPSSTDAAIYRPADNTLAFSTDGAERVRINSSGDLVLSTGCNLVFSGVAGATGGIDFSNNTTNSGATSSILDAYEEGTFTPSYIPSNSNIGSVTYDARTGRYIKVGRLCFITIRLRTDNISSVGSGTIRITGLPFTHVNQANGRAVSNNLFTSNWTGNNSPTQVLIQNNQTYMNLYQKDYNNDTASLPVSAWNTGANDNDIRLTAIYETST